MVPWLERRRGGSLWTWLTFFGAKRGRSAQAGERRLLRAPVPGAAATAAARIPPHLGRSPGSGGWLRSALGPAAALWCCHQLPEPRRSAPGARLQTGEQRACASSGRRPPPAAPAHTRTCAPRGVRSAGRGARGCQLRRPRHFAPGSLRGHLGIRERGAQFLPCPPAGLGPEMPSAWQTAACLLPSAGNPSASAPAETWVPTTLSDQSIQKDSQIRPRVGFRVSKTTLNVYPGPNYAPKTSNHSQSD